MSTKLFTRRLMTVSLRQNCAEHQGIKYSILIWFLPRDTMHKRGLCCRPVYVRPSVRHVVYCNG